MSFSMFHGQWLYVDIIDVTIVRLQMMGITMGWL